MSTPLKVRGISASKYKPSEFAALSLYFSGRNNIGNLVYTLLQCEIYLVTDFQANLLIGNNIISPEVIVINLGKKTTLIDTCKMTIDMNTKQWGQFVAKKLLTSQDSIISPCSKAMILLIKLLLLDD